MRVDGLLSSVLSAPISSINAMIARVKIMGGLNIAERRVPQDGRFHVRVMERDIDVRLSTLPTVHGEKAVMRLLDRTTFLIPKSKLGFTDTNLDKFNSLLATPHGIILITGPTGSGKSTTLYTMLDEINDIRDNISTVEDPVEYMMDGINQTQVNVKAGMTFASGLRALLRQDPDIIMIGEIRDGETVDIAIRAAITGHLVLSTIHTNDSVSAIYRLTDMGVPSYMVAASVVGIVAQRLLRKICPTCKMSYTPTQAEFAMAGVEPPKESSREGSRDGSKDSSKGKTQIFYKGAGCATCNQTGYKGRIAVHEFLIFDGPLRELIHTGASIDELKKYAVSKGLVSLRDSAYELCKSGVSTLEELIAIAHGV
jgi:type IV pilus assembly protein PilB